MFAFHNARTVPLTRSRFPTLGSARADRLHACSPVA